MGNPEAVHFNFRKTSLVLRVDKKRPWRRLWEKQLPRGALHRYILLMNCHCKSETDFEACCLPIIRGAKAPTAVALMRARYSAYVEKDMKFIEKSHDPKTRKKTDMAANTDWANETQWHGLSIVSTEQGEPSDDWGQVEFKAQYTSGDKECTHHEISDFIKRDGTWYFSQGKSPQSRQIVNTEKVPGRNEPCSCGSGKKFKKCCG